MKRHDPSAGAHTRVTVGLPASRMRPAACLCAARRQVGPVGSEVMSPSDLIAISAATSTFSATSVSVSDASVRLGRHVRRETKDQR